LYLQLSSKIADIENELQSESSKELLDKLVKKYLFIQSEPIGYGDEECDVAYIEKYEDEIVNGELIQVPTDVYPIPVCIFIDRIVELLHYAIWDVDIRTVKHFDKDIIAYSLGIRRDFIEMNKESDVWRLKKDACGPLAELLRVDRDLITQIDTIVAEYKERYHLSAGRLIPGA
jgi:hypothetical protein